jgi:hypothetical protein
MAEDASRRSTQKAKQGRAKETPAQKLQSLCGPRVTRVLDAMDKVGNLGALIKAAANEGVNGEAVVQKIQSAIAKKLMEINVELETGRKRRSAVKKRKERVDRKTVDSRRRHKGSAITRGKEFEKPQNKGKRSTSIRAISGGLPSLGKKR